MLESILLQTAGAQDSFLNFLGKNFDLFLTYTGVYNATPGHLIMDNQFRYSLVEASIQGYSKFKACDIEFSLPQPSYSIDTLRELEKRYPEREFIFIMLKKQLEDAVGKDEAKHRIVAITDAKKGALRSLADKEGYKTFIIPDNVGGRFSVLTPVGLLPIAVAGINIRELIAGAVAFEKATDVSVPFENNISEIYAAVRNELYKSGKKVEILANFNPKLHFIAEWWKQLYGESEGKDHKGIFPASVDLTTDLHSMGQWIQDGERIIFETVISVEEPEHKVIVPTDEANLDGLNFLSGKHVWWRRWRWSRCIQCRTFQSSALR